MTAETTPSPTQLLGSLPRQAPVPQLEVIAAPMPMRRPSLTQTVVTGAISVAMLLAISEAVLLTNARSSLHHSQQALSATRHSLASTKTTLASTKSELSAAQSEAASKDAAISDYQSCVSGLLRSMSYYIDSDYLGALTEIRAAKTVCTQASRESGGSGSFT